MQCLKCEKSSAWYEVCADVDLIKCEADFLGLQLNISKCEVISCNLVDLAAHHAPDGFLRVDSCDAILLGSPLVDEQGLDRMMDRKCDELELAIKRIMSLDSHYALTILRHSSGVSKIIHILRTTSCYGNPRLDRFDQILKSRLESLLNIDISEAQGNKLPSPLATCNSCIFSLCQDSTIHCHQKKKICVLIRFSNK